MKPAGKILKRKLREQCVDGTLAQLARAAPLDPSTSAPRGVITSLSSSSRAPAEPDGWLPATHCKNGTA